MICIIQRSFICVSPDKSVADKVFQDGKEVRIEFDGDLLNQRYEGKPVDYWGSSMGKHEYYRDKSYGGGDFVKYEQNYTENEDRLFSNEPFISDIKKYIKRVDILLKVKNNSKDLSINSFSNLDSLTIAYHLFQMFKNKTFVYLNENDFNAKNDKVINKWLDKQYSLYGNEPKKNSFSTISYDLFQILCFFSYAEDKNMNNEKIRKNEIGNVAKLLKHYHLDKYLNDIMKYYKSHEDKSFIIKNIDFGNLIGLIRSANQEDYVLIAKMTDDFFKSHGFKNAQDVIKKKTEQYNKERYVDYEKRITVFAFCPNDNTERYGNTIIVNPNKTLFWPLFDKDDKQYFINEIYKKVSTHGSKTNESFYKYLQHLTKSNISVSTMLNILNKLTFRNKLTMNDIIDNIFDGTFKNISLTYLTYQNQKYLNENDKEQVKNMFFEN